MNYFNGNEYDQLYPRTNMSNVSDWGNYVYSKSEVDGSIDNVSQNINNINSTLLEKIEDINNNFSNEISEINEKINSGISGIVPWNLFMTKTLDDSGKIDNLNAGVTSFQLFSGNYATYEEDVLITIEGQASVTATVNLMTNAVKCGVSFDLSNTNQNKTDNIFLGVAAHNFATSTTITDTQNIDKTVIYMIYKTNPLAIHSMNTSPYSAVDLNIIYPNLNIIANNSYNSKLTFNQPIYLNVCLFYTGNDSIYYITNNSYSYNLTFNLYKRPSLYAL